MRIREADIPDMDAIVTLARELHQMSRYKNVKPEEKQFKLTVANLMGSKNGRVMLVVDENDEPQGFMISVIMELWFSRQKYCTDFATYVREGHRQHAFRLYRDCIKWAKTKPKVIDIDFSRSSGIDDNGRWDLMMDRLGLEKAGTIWTMRV